MFNFTLQRSKHPRQGILILYTNWIHCFALNFVMVHSWIPLWVHSIDLMRRRSLSTIDYKLNVYHCYTENWKINQIINQEIVGDIVRSEYKWNGIQTASTVSLKSFKQWFFRMIQSTGFILFVLAIRSSANWTVGKQQNLIILTKKNRKWNIRTF